MSAGSSLPPPPPPPPFIYEPLAGQEVNPVVCQIPRNVTHVIIQLPSVHEQPKFLKNFKEKQVLLFMCWGSTLVNLAYLHAHSENAVYKYMMNVASMGMAASFILWLILCYVYNQATESPDSMPVVRFIKLACYASAIVALAATFQTLYFPGNKAKAIALVIACVAAAFVITLQMKDEGDSWNPN